MFPPAGLSREQAARNYAHYLGCEYAWILNRFVVTATDADSLPQNVNWRLAVLTDGDHPRADAIESKRVLRISKPAYCEVPADRLNEVKAAGALAKFRTGGLTAEAIPSVDTLASFLLGCAERKLPFKATAGLHHAIRSVHPLTYEANGPRAVMHGFINVFAAAAFAWHGEKQISEILSDQDPFAFRFDNSLHWRGLSLTTEQVACARKQFAHSFGSCSFEDPVRDLQSLGWL